MPDGSGRADAYVSVVLTDEKEMYDFRERLEELFAHILEIRVDNERTRKRLEEEPEEKGAVTPFQAFASFYEAVRHCPMTEEQETILARMVEEAGGGGTRMKPKLLTMSAFGSYGGVTQIDFERRGRDCS